MEFLDLQSATVAGWKIVMISTEMNIQTSEQQ